MNNKVVITVAVQTALIGLIYVILGLSNQGIIMLILTSVIALVLIIAFLFEPSKRKFETEITNEDTTFINKKPKICYICNTENKQTAKFCKKCGTSLSSITCPVCSRVNKFDQKYCTQCETILQNKIRH